MRFLDRFSVILLDLNGTFMFGEDRFGPEQDYHATYRALGCSRLSPDALTAALTKCHEGLARDYVSQAKFEDFPTVAEALRLYGEASDEDVAELEPVFAAHEIGAIPPSHAECLHRLAATHRLGVVSNICSAPARWLSHFETVGITPLFETVVFSSEGRTIKPSLSLFRRALERFPNESRVLFVGDNYERDVLPARALGLATAWITPLAPPEAVADVAVSSILELEHLRT